MLQFFRKHQRYFFLIITIVIIISFTFFGTYSATSAPMPTDKGAFNAVDGKEVKQSEVEQLTLFIGTDNEDKLLFGGIWGPNFLNDGVLKKDFFETGLAQILAEQYPEELKDDLQTRLAKEKKYRPYRHPQTEFVSAESAWDYFVPQKRANFYKLQQADNALDKEAFTARVNLFLDERKFPAPTLHKVLRYQEQQHDWIRPDQTLDRQDLSLFGYHTAEDWFGPRFTRLASQFIINSAKIAQKRGYRVSDSEALADLMQNSDISFRQNRENPNLTSNNSVEYFHEQLRRYGMDQRQAVKLWKQVMLFRKLFHDFGNSVLMAPFTFEKFNAYARESVEGDLYRLPEELRLGSVRDLLQFEAYLSAVSRRKEGDLKLPTTFLNAFEVAQNTPELVKKQYVLEVAEVNLKDLANKIPVREVWNWQLEEKNWPKLQREVPELAKAATRDERFAALQALDKKNEEKLNTFSRKAMINSEIIEQALAEAPLQERKVTLRQNASAFKGVKDQKELTRLLDQAPLKDKESKTPEILQKQSAKKLAKFTGDNETFYKIVVVERAPQMEILTFAEAKREGILQSLVKKNQEEEEEEKEPKILAAIRKDYLAQNPKFSKEKLTPDMTASLRFYHFAREAKSHGGASKGPWELDVKEIKVERGQSGEILNKEEAFALQPGDWSEINTFPNGDLYFFQLKGRSQANQATLSKQIANAKPLLSDDAQQMLMRELLGEMKSKNAISLDYYNRGNDESQS